MDYFSLFSLGLLVVLMGLAAWWAFRSYKRARWVRFTIATLVLLLLGFTWQYFPVIVFLILAPIFGWSFS